MLYIHTYIHTHTYNRFPSCSKGDLLNCMVFTAGMVTDLGGNPIAGNSPQRPTYIHLAHYLPDSVPPQILAFQVRSTYVIHKCNPAHSS